jgi:hypothetical protein
MRIALLSIVFGVGLLAAPYDVPAPAQPPAELRPTWTEFKWPFPVDQWGIGRAFGCKPAECGVEVNVYLRPKIGFCKCATGVDDDDELERVSDNVLIAADTIAHGPGRVVEVAWMHGRSRIYRFRALGKNASCRSRSTTAATSWSRWRRSEREIGMCWSRRCSPSSTVGGCSTG